MIDYSEDADTAIERIYKYSLLQAISRRRSRRFGCGFTIPTGALEHQSIKKARPLTKEETAIICYAGAGMTGLTENADISVGLSQNITNYGRSFPSACNAQHTYLLFTNDEGVFLYHPRPPSKIVQIENIGELGKMLGSFEHDRVRLLDKRLEMPPSTKPFLSSNIYTANKLGQTVFITIGDLTYELINLLLFNAHFEGRYLYDDIAKRPAGDRAWIDRLKLHTPLHLSAFESSANIVHAEESGFITQNILLMAEALGLGAWPFSGFNSNILMGGSPFAKGLGFRFVADKKGNRFPVGFDNSPLVAHCPPYMTMIDAVDSIVEDKFGIGGFYDPDRRPSAYKEPTNVIDKVRAIPEEVIACVKNWCDYLHQTYGRFPVTANPLVPYLCVGITHLDIDFYDKYYHKELINSSIRDHMTLWHSCDGCK